ARRCWREAERRRAFAPGGKAGSQAFSECDPGIGGVQGAGLRELCGIGQSELNLSARAQDIGRKRGVSAASESAQTVPFLWVDMGLIENAAESAGGNVPLLRD